MQYFDPEQGADLRAAFDEAVLEWPGVTAHTMFGCPSYKAGDTLFAVLVTDGVVLTRLPEDQRDVIDASFEAGPFQASGRTVTKWDQVDVDDASDLESLLPFVEASYGLALEES